MKVLIHDERPDALEFLLGSIINYGYSASIAKNGFEIMHMLSGNQYSVILTNGSYQELDMDQRFRMKSSPVFVIGIKDPQRHDERIDPSVDLYLHRPFEASKLRKAIATSWDGASEVQQTDDKMN